MNRIGDAAKGYPERAYAKWLVLHFVWSHIAPMLRSRSRIERFRQEWEYGGRALDYLWRANNVAFNAALKFFRLKRGKGPKAADVSTFFKRRNLHREFEKFWHSSSNNRRAAFQKALKQFNKRLSEDRYE